MMTCVKYRKVARHVPLRFGPISNPWGQGIWGNPCIWSHAFGVHNLDISICFFPGNPSLTEVCLLSVFSMERIRNWNPEWLAESLLPSWGVKEVVQDLSSGSYPTWVGANIVGPETGAEQWRNLRADTKPEDFKKHQWSIHAGELDFPNDAVWKAVVTMNASRIGHGVNWLDLEPDLKKKTLQELRERNILIETNLVSNKVLHTVPSWKDHPLRQFLEFKIPTCLCSDDPGIFGSTLTDEYMLAAEFLHRDSMLEVFIKMGKDSLKHAFVPTTVKQDLIQRFEENVDRFNQLLSCLSMGSCQEKLALIQASYFACHQWPTLCMDMPVFDRLESFLLDVPPLSWWSWWNAEVLPPKTFSHWKTPPRHLIKKELAACQALFLLF